MSDFRGFGIRVLYSDILESDIPHYKAETFLTPEDLKRYNGYRFKDDKSRFLCSRILIGKFLAEKYSGDRYITPVTITYNENGRPGIQDSPYEISITHSGRFSAVAFASGRNIGIDLEFIRSKADLRQLSQRFFASDESSFLERCSNSQLAENFFRIWCAKEAFLKATGKGLSYGLRNFSVVDEEGNLKTSVCDRKTGQFYNLTELEIDSNCKCCLCFESRDLLPEISLEKIMLL